MSSRPLYLHQEQANCSLVIINAICYNSIAGIEDRQGKGYLKDTTSEHSQKKKLTRANGANNTI